MKITKSFSTFVKVVKQDSISIITLVNEKKRNPLSKECLKEFYNTLESFKNEQFSKVIIINSLGPVFSAGHDLKEIQQLSNDDAREVFELCSRVCILIRKLPQPVIAQVNGLATAAGCQLALSCDLITASTNSAFQTPGLKVGLFCTTPGVELARALPLQKVAMEMLLTAEPLSAKEAHRLGMINRVCEPDQLEKVTLELAQKITQFSGESIGLGKRVFYKQSSMDSLEQAYELGCQTMTENLTKEDCKEGVKAFIEKRHPHFKN